jgi:hypothetical protein
VALDSHLRWLNKTMLELDGAGTTRPAKTQSGGPAPEAADAVYDTDRIASAKKSHDLWAFDDRPAERN